MKNLQAVPILPTKNTAPGIGNDNSESPLFKTLTETVTSLGSNGKWAELIELLSNQHGKATGHLCTCSLIRALAFSGQWIAANTLKAHLYSRLLGSEERCLLALTESLAYRQKQNWYRALMQAQRALVLSRRSQSIHLFFDAQFAVALCTSELGRKYYALDMYRKIRLAPSASNYRKELAAINEMFLLNDFGQPEQLSELADYLPLRFRIRARLYIEILNLNDKALESLAKEFLKSDFDPSEKTAILLTLMEYNLVKPKNFTTVIANWCTTLLRQLLSIDRSSWITQIAEALFHTKTPLSHRLIQASNTLDTLIKESNESSWRNLLDQRWMQTLVWAHLEPQKALQIIHLQLDSLLLKYQVRPTLMLSKQCLKFPRYEYHRLAAQLFGKSENQKEKFITVAGTDLIIESEGHSLRMSLLRSPQSLELISFLQGQIGKEIQKESIHIALTGNRYSPDKHDDRLRKLIGRLERRIQHELGVTPWSWSGLGTLVLNVNIIKKEIKGG